MSTTTSDGEIEAAEKTAEVEVPQAYRKSAAPPAEKAIIQLEHVTKTYYRGKEPLTFQLALSPHVKTPSSITNGKATFTRGSAVLNVEGFDSITNTPTGPLLLSHLNAGTARSFLLK